MKPNQQQRHSNKNKKNAEASVCVAYGALGPDRESPEVLGGSWEVVGGLVGAFGASETTPRTWVLTLECLGWFSERQSIIQDSCS